MLASVQSKQYYKIGEVARLAQVNCSVLRFWETEFAVLSPIKSRSGQRRYTQSDVELVLAIKRLLYEEKLTIAGARGRLANAELLVVPEHRIPVVSPQENSVLKDIYRELRLLRDALDREH